MRKLFFTTIFCGLFLFALPALGAEFYIDAQNGNDANAGTEAAPWQTLDKIMGINGGDTVYLQGTFTSAFSIDLPNSVSGTSINPTIITNWPGKVSTIKPVPGGINFTVMGSHISFLGLNFSNNGIYSINTMAFIIVDGQRGITISDCQIYDHEFGIFAVGGGGIFDVNIINNDFQNNGMAIYLIAVTEYNILRNKIHNSNSTGPNMGLYSIISKDGVTANNFFYNNGHGFWEIQGDNINAINNTFYKNSTAFQTTLTNNLNFKNNIASHNTTYAVFHEQPINADFDYNLYYNNADVGFRDSGAITAHSLADWQALGFDEHSIVGQPYYWSEAAATFDLHIKKKSAARNTGTDLSSYITEDVDQEVRPHGSAFDIGADEFYGYKPDRVTGVKVPKKYKKKKKVKVKWDRQADETVYRINLYQKRNNGKMKLIRKILTKKEGKANKYIKNLKPGKSYRVKVLGKRIVRYRTFKSAKWSKLYKFKTKQ